MNRIIKGGLLFTALLLPVLIFLFLKTFGKNQFDIPVYNHTSLEEGVNCESVELPHLVESPGGIRPLKTVNIYHLSLNTAHGELRNLMSVKDRLSARDAQMTSLLIATDSAVQLDAIRSKYQIGGVFWKAKYVTPSDMKEYMACELMTTAQEKIVLVDRERKIRGYYDINDEEEIDRLILESKILLHGNEK